MARELTDEEKQRVQRQESPEQPPTGQTPTGGVRELGTEERQRVQPREDEVLPEGYLRGIRRRAEEAVTGQGRGGGERPELGATDLGSAEQNFRTGLALFTTPDEQSRRDILRRTIPGVSFRQDDQGNTVVQLPDEREVFLNAPGFSRQDFADFASDVVKFLPAGRFAAGGRSLMRRLARGGIAGGGTAVAEDVAAGAQGSQQGVSPGRAGGTAAADMAAEAASGRIARIGNIFRRAFGRRTGDIADETGNLTPRARRALERAGFNPDEISPELAESAIRLSERGGRGPGLQGAAASQQFDVPLTRGQATGDFNQLELEERLRRRGDEAGRRIREFDERQDQRFVESTQEMQERIGGGQPALRDEPEAGSRLGGEVRGQADELDTAVDEAFENARGRNASLTRDGLDRLANAAEVLEERNVLVDEQLTPATRRGIKEIQTLTGDDVSEQPVKELDRVRQRINQLQDAASNAQDRRGVTILKRQFDRFTDDAIDQALFEGDDQAIDMLKEARRLRAEYGRRFQENTRRNRSGRQIPDPGGRTVEAIVENNPTDQQTVNFIFGQGRLFGKDAAVQSVRALRRATEDAESVNDTLKQLAFRRISRNAVDDGKFSARKFVSAFNKSMEENGELMREIYSENDLKAIREFRDTARRSITPEGARNPSGTAGALTRALGTMGQALGLQRAGIGFGAIGGRIGRAAGGAGEAVSARQDVEEAVNPQFLLPGRPSDTVVASTIAGIRQGGPTAGDIAVPSEDNPLDQPSSEDRNVRPVARRQ